MSPRTGIDALLGVTRFALARGSGDNRGAIVSKDPVSWREFVDLLRTPQVDRAYSHAEFLALKKRDRNDLKAKAGWIVPGAFKRNWRDGPSLLSRSMVNADIDDATPELLRRIKRGEFKHEFVAHTTRSSTPDAPHIRIYAPLDTPLAPDDYADAAAEFTALFVETTIDRCGEKPEQFMYLPQISRDQEYWLHVNDGPRWKPSGVKRPKPERPAPLGEWTHLSDAAALREALMSVKNDALIEPMKSAIARAGSSYDLWRNIGWSIRAEAGDDGYDIFVSWSETWASGAHDPAELDEVWDGYRPGKIDGRLVYSLARAAGWLDPAIIEKFDDLGPPEDPHPLSIPGMNKKYAAVKLKGQTIVAHFREHEIDYGPTAALHAWHANKTVEVGKKTLPASVAWWSSPARREYEGVVFAPGGREVGAALNLWTGWGIDPKPGASCTLILKHIREVIANGDREVFNYLTRYDAHMIQRPGEKPGVARAFRGGEGSGKDTYGELLRRIVGDRHTAVIGDSTRLTARFNSQLEAALFVHLEEALFAADPRESSKLKHLVTSRRIGIERKGLETILVDSFFRIFMSTNHDWVVPAGHDARRYAVFDVSERHKQDTAYFAALREEIFGDGAGAYMAYLQQVDLTGFDIRGVPRTEALDDQKRLSRDLIEQWWGQVLEDGRLDTRHIELKADGWTQVEKRELRHDYEAFVTRRRGHARDISKPLKRLCADIQDARPRTNLGQRSDRNRPAFYRIPPLDQCKRLFERATGVYRSPAINDLVG